MADVRNNSYVSMQDFITRTNPDGSLAEIMEVLKESSPVLTDIPWKEGNMRTGNMTTQRTAIPKPQIRRVNRGIDPSKTATEQVMDDCMFLEDRSVIDTKLLRMQNDARAYRNSEDAGFAEGFGQVISRAVFYGNSELEPDQFDGLIVRYPYVGGTVKGKPAYQAISAGTPSANNNTTAFLIGWGERATTGFYPKGSQLGLVTDDLGEMDVLDRENKPFRAVVTLFQWDLGLAVQDIRTNALLRNIDVSGLDKLDAEGRRLWINNFIKTKNRVRSLSAPGLRPVWYVSDAVYTFIETYLIDKNNVHVTRQELMNRPPELMLSGIPVKKDDAISEHETPVAEYPTQPITIESPAGASFGNSLYPVNTENRNVSTPVTSNTKTASEANQKYAESANAGNSGGSQGSAPQVAGANANVNTDELYTESQLTEMKLDDLKKYASSLGVEITSSDNSKSKVIEKLDAIGKVAKGA